MVQLQTLPEYTRTALKIVGIKSPAYYSPASAKKSFLTFSDQNFHPRSKLFWLLYNKSQSPMDIVESLVGIFLVMLALFLHKVRKTESLELLNYYPGLNAIKAFFLHHQSYHKIS